MSELDIRHDVLPVTDVSEQAQSVGALTRIAQVGAVAVVAAELGPFNEVARGTITTVAEVVSSSPYTTAAAFAGATLAIEAGAGVVTAGLLASPGADKVTGWLNDKLKKVNIGKDGHKTGVVGDLILGASGGSAVAVFAKHVQDPERTLGENVRFGIANSALVTGLVTPVVYGVSKTAEVVGWENVGIGAGLLAATALAIHKVRSKLRGVSESQQTQIAAETAYESVPSRYDLTKEEVSESEQQLVDLVRDRIGRKACAVWIPSDSPHANAIRTREAAMFEGIAELMQNTEDTSKFLAVIDARPSAGVGRLIRATRLTSPLFAKDPETADPVSSMALTEGLVDSGQVTRDEIGSYYETQAFDLHGATSVETNFKVGERAPRIRRQPMSQLAYAAMCRFAVSHTPEGATTSLVAHANDETMRSMDNAGVDYEPFAGRDDLKTPDVGGGFDDKYKPVVYVYRDKTKRKFKLLDRIAKLPEIEL